jgi:predicted N-acetyltransferase YhbS
VAPTLGPARLDELDEIAALCERCLPPAGPQYFSTRFRADPAAAAGIVLVARDGGQVVATVTVLSLALRAGDAVIPCGGIANVATDPAWRRRGLARGLLEEAHRRLAARGIPVSLLATAIPDFYRPLGYRTWDRPDRVLLRTRAPDAPPDAAVRPLDLARDLPALAALKEAYDRRLAGPAVRPAETWAAQAAWTRAYPGEDPSLGLVATDAGGAPVAFVRGSADPARAWSRVLDFACAPGSEAAVAALAAAWLRAAMARGARAVQVPAAAREWTRALEPFAEAAADVPNEGLMLRIGSVEGLVAAAAPGLAGPDGGDARAGLVPEDWIAVVFGGRPFSSRPFAAGSRLDEKTLNRLDAAFPTRPSVFWSADDF